MLIGLRPGDAAYDSHTGMDFNAQDANNGNIAFYDIINEGDELQFDLRQFTGGITQPLLILNTVFGPTDFELRDRNTGGAVVEEQSGFDSDVWAIDITDASGRFTLTDFDTGNGVGGTQAAWYPYCRVLPLQG